MSYTTNMLGEDEYGDGLFSEYFRTSRYIPLALTDYTLLGEDVMNHFAAQEYTVSGMRLASGGWHISIYKGDWFRLLLGLKTALNIRITPTEGGTTVTAGIGIFELQALPLAITAFVFAPIIFAQIWGIIQQQQLDEEAVNYVEDRLAYYGGITGVASDPAPDPYTTTGSFGSGPAAPTEG